MKTKKINTEILNDLMQINNDRVVGYEKAIEELKAEDSDLKLLFIKMIGESHKNKMALATEIQVMGADADKNTTTSGKIHRAWMGVKAMFSGHDREAILTNCEFGEGATQLAYETALEQESLSANLRLLIMEQKANLKISHDEIETFRDVK